MAGILELRDLRPEMIPVRIERTDESTSATTTVVLMSFKDGPRCPVSKKVELAQIRQRLIEQSKEDFNHERGIHPALIGVYVRETLMAMIQGLQYDEAELIAADDELSYKVMVYLGLWTEQDEDVDQGEVNAAQ